jgi:large subunit ribosomal protein L21e
MTIDLSFQRGDYVDIKVDSSIHKGMPFKHYHGRTGVVFNVNKRAVGVIVNKEVNGRIIQKRIHVAVPHVKPSKCQAEIIARVKANEGAKKAVREGTSEKVSLKRQHTQPKAGYFYTVVDVPKTIQPQPYVDLV